MPIKRFVLSVICAVSSSANAALIYDEAISGDIAALTVFSLDIGTNTITGSLQFEAEQWSADFVDYDIFDVYVPDGMRLESIAISSQLGAYTTPTNLPQFDANYALYCSSENPNSSGNCSGLGGTELGSATFLYRLDVGTTDLTYNTVDALGDLSGDTYYTLWVPNSSGWWLPNTPDGATYVAGSVDYSIVLEVASVSEVPAPAAIWLFGSGVIGLFGFNRLRKA